MTRRVAAFLLLTASLPGYAGGSAAAEQRPQAFEPGPISVVIPSGNQVSAAAQVALSSAWSTLTETQRQQLTQVFVPIVAHAFDFPALTELAVGPAWSGFTATERAQVIHALGRYISVVLTERLDTHSGDRVELVGTRPAPGGVIIMSRIVKPDARSIRLDCLIQQKSDGWHISDVYINGTYSVAVTLHDQLAGILRNQGVNGLIAALNDKATALGAARTPKLSQ